MNWTLTLLSLLFFTLTLFPVHAQTVEALDSTAPSIAQGSTLEVKSSAEPSALQEQQWPFRFMVYSSDPQKLIGHSETLFRDWGLDNQESLKGLMGTRLWKKLQDRGEQILKPAGQSWKDLLECLESNAIFAITNISDLKFILLGRPSTQASVIARIKGLSQEGQEFTSGSERYFIRRSPEGNFQLAFHFSDSLAMISNDPSIVEDFLITPELANKYPSELGQALEKIASAVPELDKKGLLLACLMDQECLGGNHMARYHLPLLPESERELKSGLSMLCLRAGELQEASVVSCLGPEALLNSLRDMPLPEAIQAETSEIQGTLEIIPGAFLNVSYPCSSDQALEALGKSSGLPATSALLCHHSKGSIKLFQGYDEVGRPYLLIKSAIPSGELKTEELKEAISRDTQGLGVVAVTKDRQGALLNVICRVPYWGELLCLNFDSSENVSLILGKIPEQTMEQEQALLPRALPNLKILCLNSLNIHGLTGLIKRSDQLNPQLREELKLNYLSERVGGFLAGLQNQRRFISSLSLSGQEESALIWSLTRVIIK